jgi:hypothetical protein
VRKREIERELKREERERDGGYTVKRERKRAKTSQQFYAPLPIIHASQKRL